MTEGNSVESLFSALSTVENTIKTECIFKPDQKIQIECVYHSGNLKNWRMKSQNRSSAISQKWGNRYTSFEELLEHLNEQKELFTDGTNCTVLCHRNTELQRSDGKIISYWYSINPYNPYTLEKGQPKFPVVRMKLSETDYNFMMETKLAFRTEDAVYPICSEAASAIGSFMDCSSAFKVKDDHMLGAGLLLAEKLSQTNGINVTFRNEAGTLRPIIGIMGRRYCKISQKDFFTKAFNKVSEYGIYTLGKWSITDKYSEIEVLFIDHFQKGYQHGFLITAGDLAGASLSVTALIKTDKTYIHLKRNSEPHSMRFLVDGIERLFEGMNDVFEEFDSMYEILRITRIQYSDDLLIPFRKLIGKKRMNALALSLNDHTLYKADFAYTEIISAISKDIPTAAKAKAYHAFYELLRTIVQEEVGVNENMA